MYVYNVHYVLTEIYGCTDYQVFSDEIKTGFYMYKRLRKEMCWFFKIDAEYFSMDVILLLCCM